VSDFERDEALAFIDAMRLTIQGKIGFKWMTEKLSALAVYIESVAADNARLNAYIDQAGLRGDYESTWTKSPEAAHDEEGSAHG